MADWTADAVVGRIDDDLDGAIADLVSGLGGYAGLERVSTDDMAVRETETGRIFRVEWTVVDAGIPTPEAGDLVVFRDGTDGADGRGGSGPDGKVIGEIVEVSDGLATVEFRRTLNRGSDYAKDLVGDEAVDGVLLSQLEIVE